MIFPVDAVDGQTVALVGRAVDDTATDRSGAPVPKYLNSPETAIYRKSEHLYGLGPDAAQAFAAGATPVLVEGPMDVLAINRAATRPAGGIPGHVGVAPCGTALTVQQVQLLDEVTGGLADRGVVVAFDGDQAGRHASLRAYELLRAVRAWPSALDLPRDRTRPVTCSSTARLGCGPPCWPQPARRWPTSSSTSGSPGTTALGRRPGRGRPGRQRGGGRDATGARAAADPSGDRADRAVRTAGQ
jgi:hypothetical protein